MPARLTLAITWPHPFGAATESFEGAALVHGDVGRLMHVNKMTWIDHYRFLPYWPNPLSLTSGLSFAFGVDWDGCG